MFETFVHKVSQLISEGARCAQIVRLVLRRGQDTRLTSSSIKSNLYPGGLTS